MNKENVLAVADAIEGHTIPDLGFNMTALIDEGPLDRSGRGCRTVACIAGWATALKKNLPAEPYYGGIMKDAQQWLDLTDQQAADLFSIVEMDWNKFIRITPVQAVAVLRHLADTDIVNWRAAS